MQESEMSVQRKLEAIRYILGKVAENPECVKITGFDKTAIQIFIEEGIDAVLKRYKKEAKRNEARRYRKYHFH
jgi:hypothetical protein